MSTLTSPWISVVQLNSGEHLSDNLAALETPVRQAARDGARVVVLPENFAYFGAEGGKRAVAEDLAEGGPIVSQLRRLARTYDVFVIAGGLPEKSSDPKRPFNTSTVLSPEGNLIASYRKLHLFDVELPDGSKMTESSSTMAGDEVRVVDIDGVRFGLTICYDLRFPLLFDALTKAGAECIVVSAAFTEQTGKDHWHALLRARAIENQVWLAAAAQWGVHPGNKRTYGHSLICDPWGTIVAERGEGPGIVTSELDLAYLAEVRRRLPCLTHRRDMGES